MLTRSGLAAVCTALALVVLGWWWHYDELVVLGVAASVAVVAALWASRTATNLEIKRVVPDPRVARGDPIKVEYRVLNRRRRRSAAAVIVDSSSAAPPASAAEPGASARVDAPVDTRIDASVRVTVPPIEPLQRADLSGRIPTHRRGLFTVGPWALERVDALGLAAGTVASTATTSIIVHPRIHTLGGPYGDMHSVQEEAIMRRVRSDPLSGFVSLREYVDGDDPRLIHWPTSARTGTLMMREHVELRRPEFTVVLDTSDAASAADPAQFEADFEEMVDVTASIAVHAIRSGVEVRLRTTSSDVPGAHFPLEHETQVLDLLTPVAPTPAASTTSLAATLFGQAVVQRHGAMVIVVTGPRGPSQALGSIVAARVIRVGAMATTAPGVELAVTDAAEFARRWIPWD